MKKSAAVLVCASFLAFTVFYYQYQAWNEEGNVTKPMTKNAFPSSELESMPSRENTIPASLGIEAIKDKISAIMHQEDTNIRPKDKVVDEHQAQEKQSAIFTEKPPVTKQHFKAPLENRIKTSPPDPTFKTEATTFTRPPRTPHLFAKTPKIVIILAQTRSGSSFLGEIFNQRNDVAYFYEPLYPFGTCPRTESRGIIDYFYSILRFDFNSTREIYKNAFSISKRIDNQCQATGICFSMCEKCAAFIYRDAHLCLPSQTNGCQVENFLNGVSGHAKTVKLLAFKVCYLCDLKWIEPILKNPAYDVKIVHLVRDPRAIIKSKISYKHTPTTIDMEIVRDFVASTCQHLETMTKYADTNLLHDKNKYFRVRHEDFSLDAVEWTHKIYDFVGLQMTNDVKKWIISATSEKNSKDLSEKSQFGTRRNSAEVVVSWRKELLFEQIEAVQDHCQYYMMSSDYRSYDDEATVRNLDEKSF